MAAVAAVLYLTGATVQQVVANPQADAETAALAQMLTPADVQLYYQMALHGRRDLPLAPDPRSGFEMLLLRMLAFRISDAQPLAITTPVPVAVEKKKILNPPDALPIPVHRPPPPPAQPIAQPIVESVPPPVVVVPDVVVQPIVAPVSPPVVVAAPTVVETPVTSHDWHTMLPQLGLTDMALPLAQHCLLGEVTAEQVTLLLDTSGENLRMELAEQQIQSALIQYFGRELKLCIVLQNLTDETPEQRGLRNQRERQAMAEQAIQMDPFVQKLQKELGAVIVGGSIRPRTENGKL